MSIPPQQIGTIIYPIRNSNGHNYKLGKPYIVSYVDDDGTFKAKDPDSQQEGNWLRWEDVSLYPPIGWLWLKKVLHPDVVSLLSVFEGIESLILNEAYKDVILHSLPDLHKRLVSLSRKQERQHEDTSGKVVSFPKMSSSPSIPQMPFTEDTGEGQDEPAEEKHEGPSFNDTLNIQFDPSVEEKLRSLISSHIGSKLAEPEVEEIERLVRTAYESGVRTGMREALGYDPSTISQVIMDIRKSAEENDSDGDDDDDGFDFDL